jgi:hypothetical protein
MIKISGAFYKSAKRDQLRFLGYTEEEIKAAAETETPIKIMVIAGEYKKQPALILIRPE